jgi:hypothetical protein
MADVVVNVESSHCYQQMGDFFKGVAYLLKDDGVFVYVDFRLKKRMNNLKALIQKHFDIVGYEDISKNVVQSLAIQDDIKTTRILGE